LRADEGQELCRVAHPALIRSVGKKLPVEQIDRDLLIAIAHRRASEIDSLVSPTKPFSSPAEPFSVAGASVIDENHGSMDDAYEKQRTRVLVVDDEEPVRTLAERALRNAGYEVAAASDGYEALRVVEAQGRFDLFVIDLYRCCNSIKGGPDVPECGQPRFRRARGGLRRC